MKLTATIERGENSWLIGQVKEFPAAIAQGKTIEELKANLSDALILILEVNNIDELQSQLKSIINDLKYTISA